MPNFMKIGQAVHIKDWHKRTETENLTSMCGAPTEVKVKWAACLPHIQKY
jgi:hypothetical protein